jgi:hypothetical protein
MAEPRRDVMDTRDLGEILAALRELARESSRTEHATEVEDETIRRILPALTPDDIQ